MRGTLDDRYLAWLHFQVGGRSAKGRDPERSYWDLLKQMYSTEFIWFIPNDDNRAEDGRDLRNEFTAEQGISLVDPGWSSLGCSFLEMLVGLSRRMAFEAGGRTHLWFWHFIQTLGLSSCTDASGFDPQDVAEVLDTVIWRTYDSSGHGGLFPLEHTTHDQTEVEIWYQLSEWLLQQ